MVIFDEISCIFMYILSSSIYFLFFFFMCELVPAILSSRIASSTSQGGVLPGSLGQIYMIFVNIFLMQNFIVIFIEIHMFLSDFFFFF